MLMSGVLRLWMFVRALAGGEHPPADATNRQHPVEFLCNAFFLHVVPSPIFRSRRTCVCLSGRLFDYMNIVTVVMASFIALFLNICRGFDSVYSLRSLALIPPGAFAFQPDPLRPAEG